MGRIVVVDHNQETKTALVSELRLARHHVCQFGLARDALDFLGREAVDVVVLEWGLPDMAGSEFCRRLRISKRARATSIVMISGGAEEFERIVALELGVDDCVAKPLCIREVVLRVQRLVRGAAPPLPSGYTFSLGALRARAKITESDCGVMNAA